MNFLKGWRTIAINLSVGALVAITESARYLAVFDWREVLPADLAPWAILFFALLNIWLRAITTTPMGKKQ